MKYQIPPSSFTPTSAWNGIIWGDKKYVLPSLLDEFAGKVDLIYIDPPFATGANFSYKARIHPENGSIVPSGGGGGVM